MKKKCLNTINTKYVAKPFVISGIGGVDGTSLRQCDEAAAVNGSLCDGVDRFSLCNLAI